MLELEHIQFFNGEAAIYDMDSNVHLQVRLYCILTQESIVVNMIGAYLISNPRSNSLRCE
jgi:hypothetical protein